MTKSAEHRLHDLLDGLDTAMLITHTSQGYLNARPMGVAELSDTGEIFFVSAGSSAKVKEIKADSDVTLVFQGKQKFISMNGSAVVLKDQALVDKLWSEAWRVWFPEGKTDPSLRILKVSPTDAEYWDNAGVKGISYVFEAAKAYISGKTPDVSEKQHGKIDI